MTSRISSPKTSSTSLPQKIKSAVSGLFTRKAGTGRADVRQKKRGPYTFEKHPVTERDIGATYAVADVKAYAKNPKDLKKVAANLLASALKKQHKDKLEAEFDKMFGSADGTVIGKTNMKSIESYTKAFRRELREINDKQAEQEKKFPGTSQKKTERLETLTYLESLEDLKDPAREEKAQTDKVAQQAHDRLKSRYVNEKIEEMLDDILKNNYKEADFKAVVQKMKIDTDPLNPLSSYANALVADFLKKP